MVASIVVGLARIYYKREKPHMERLRMYSPKKRLSQLLSPCVLIQNLLAQD